MGNSNNKIGAASASDSYKLEGSDGVISVGDGKCAICSIPSKLKCSGCNQINYCSGNHQKEDWKRHKPKCRPFILKSNEKLGRYLVAARNIKAGEVVLKEAPLIRGPSRMQNDIACVGCLREINGNHFLQCEHCGWPICQRECQNHPEHKAECEFTLKTRGCKLKTEDFDASSYQYLTTLRCVLLKNVNPQKYKRLIQLESHQESTAQNSAQNSEPWDKDLKNFVLFMKRYFYTDLNFDSSLNCARMIDSILENNEWSENEVIAINGILKINTFTIYSIEVQGRGIFDYASLFEHSCYPNLTNAFTTDNEIIVRAPFDIKKGTNLSISYIDARWATVRRQTHLLQTKLFKCECERCKDVTEIGTFYSALRCNKKKCDGLAVPMSLETFDQDWKCNKCSNILEKTFVHDIIERAENDLAVLDKRNKNNYIRYINVYSKYLSNQHYFICDAKNTYVTLNVDPRFLDRINNKELNILIQFYKDLIEIYERLSPVALIAHLGSLCFKLHKLLYENSRRTNDMNTVKRCLKEALEYIEKSIEYLQYNLTLKYPKEFCGNAKTERDFLKKSLEHPSWM